MKRILISMAIFAFTLAACSAQNTLAEQTGLTTAVPLLYSRPAKNQGKVERLDYTSKDYVRDSKAITKTAYIYLPYGYDPNGTTRYNIIYLMHGWGGTAGEYFTVNGGVHINPYFHI